MPTPATASYGSWKSPITSDLIVAETIRLGDIVLDGEEIYWIEMRPSEGGRNVIVCRLPDGRTQEMTPAPYNVRTRVHEYGGGSFTVVHGTIYFSNFADQRIYRRKNNEEPQPITPEGKDIRYADSVFDRSRSRLIAVREDHADPEHEAVNTIISLDVTCENEGQILVAGSNFYSTPRLSPDGTQLAWLTWNHPNMPWDGTELQVGTFQDDGVLGNIRTIAGGKTESIFQPQWSPNGTLFFVSDRSGWWNLYHWQDGQVDALCEMEAEFGLPQWVFGMSTYSVVSADQLICAYNTQGTWQLACFDIPFRTIEILDLPYTSIDGIQANLQHVVFTAGSPRDVMSIIRLDPETTQTEVLRSSSTLTVDDGYISRPETIEFPTEDNLTAYGFFYPPANKDYHAPAGELPPLMVIGHGGPTAAAATVLNFHIQYWTSRGFAVLDVNYGGSTGYGRAYRERLNGTWGVVDVDDCANGARYLVKHGRVDGTRLAIRGGSAGGYTTLCALTFRSVFHAGASYYGVSNVEALAKETHKFESRYLDSLIGPYPKQQDLYRSRSAMHFADQISCPVIFFQGLEDKIVPPNQAECMFEALRNKGLPTAYIAYEGEQHGFRQAKNIKHALDTELYFYAKVFGFDPADPIEPISIENL